VVDNKVYFTARSKRLYCLNATTGAFLWSKSLGFNWDLTVPPLDDGTWLDSSPAVADSVVYVGSRNGKMYAFDADDGDAIWVTDLGSEIMSSPMYYDNKIFVGTWGEIFYCLDANNGNIKAFIGLDGGILNSPAVSVVIEKEEDITYMIGEDGLDGEAYWLKLNASETAFIINKRYDTECTVRSSFCSCDTWVYLGDGSSAEHDDPAGLHCFTYPGFGLNGPTWTYPDGQTAQGGHEWTCATPAVSGNMVYMGGGKNSPEVYCVRDNGTTKTEMWTFDLSNAYHPMGVHSSPAVADGKVFVGLVQGNASNQTSWLYCLDADDGDSLWTYNIGPGRVLSSPAIYDGKVYIGSPGGVLYCFGE
jgi:outer membrane protein assembly factor BamB